MTHRAKDLDGNEVKGYWCKTIDGTHFIIPPDARAIGGDKYPAIDCGIVKIDPDTLAMNTGVDGIYGSFEYEDGKMSIGGDEIIMEDFKCKTITGLVMFVAGRFVVVDRNNKLRTVVLDALAQIEIIGPACDVEDK